MMKRQRPIKGLLSCIMAVMLGLFMGTGMSAMNVWAASGTIYTCSVHPCYAHPVTGVIEDSGGQGSYATGQGMVDGCIGDTGLMERTDSGEYYLTIRMSLMDFTANQSFMVQEVGASGWSVPEMGVTGTGTDQNGTTADVCIKVPSESCVIRGSMYVTPMGRDVIFYIYPDNYVAGNSTDMTPAIVTEASGAQNSVGVQNVTDVAPEAGVQNVTDVTPNAGESGNPVIAPEIYAEIPRPDELANVNTSASVDASAQAPTMQSTITQAAVPQIEVEATGGSLNSTRGLSLSTENAAARAAAEAGNGSGDGAGTSGNRVGSVTDTDSQSVVLTTSITISGLIILAATAMVVYYFRKNWRKWGGYDEED